MRMRKSLAFLLALAMLISLFPAMAFAASADETVTDPWSIEDASEKTVYYTILDEEDQPTETRAVTAYEDSYLDSESEFTVRIYVPEGADADSPIAYIVNNSGWTSNGHMLADAGKDDTGANLWDATDESAPAKLYPATHSVPAPSNDNYGAGKYAGQALEAGYVVVTAQLRARSNDNHSPVTVGDAKAVIRYLRHNADALPAGDVDYIIVSGMSGGGALTSAIGASGNSNDYLPYLYALGAAGVEYIGEDEAPTLANYMDYTAADFTDSLTDDVFAAVVYAPITDLDHADLAYAWTYLGARMALAENSTNASASYFNEAAITSSQELGADFVEYVDSLGLTYNGEAVDATFNAETGEIGGVLADVISDLMKASIQYRIDNADAPYFLGLSMVGAMEARGYASKYSISEEAQANNAWKTAWLDVAEDETKTDVETFDLDEFLYYVAGVTALKNPPAFDGKNAQTGEGKNESNLYGLEGQTYNHILEYTFKYDSYTVELYDPETKNPETAWKNYVDSGDYAKVQQQARMINSVPYLLDSEGEDQGDSAPHWYLRMGMLDRDTSFATVALLYLSLLNAEDVEDVDARFTWDRVHAWQPYHDTPDAFEWVQETVEEAKKGTIDGLSFSDATATVLNTKLDGEDFKVTMYEDLYLNNTTHNDQKVAVYVSEKATEDSPIILMVGNSGWQSNSYAKRKGPTEGGEYSSTSDKDAVGKALSEGYVIVSYGCRSRNNGANEDGLYMGHSPATMTDTKAVIRWLRYNADLLPAGDPEKIVVTGGSGGGALSVVIAGSGDSADYYPSLYAAGAAGILKNADGSYTNTLSDAVWATIAYCPITDLGNACAAYEWTFGATREAMYADGLMDYATSKPAATEDAIMAASEELSAIYVDYIDSLGIEAVNSKNLEATIIELMKAEIDEAIEEVGIEQMKTDLAATDYDGTWLTFNEDGSYDYDYEEHLYWLARKQTLKAASAFSNVGIQNWAGQNEDNLFGSATDDYSPFNEYSWNNDNTDNNVGKDDTGKTWDEFMETEDGARLALQLKMTSPIQYLLDGDESTSADYWYVRHGMADRDTSFAVEAVLAKVIEADESVKGLNFEFTWLQGHGGNYDVQEAYAWLAEMLAAEDEPTQPVYPIIPAPPAEDDKDDEEKPEITFTDVTEGKWFYADVMYAAENGLMNGVGDEKFNPYGTASRAMVVTVLYRIAGEPAVTGSNSFTDLTADWYKDAVQWAVETGITKGVTNTKFNPNAPVTRQEIATFLYRFAKAEAVEVDLSKYEDADDIAAWALDAMAWANAEGLITGVDENTLAPNAESNRAQLATILARFDKNVK